MSSATQGPVAHPDPAVEANLRGLLDASPTQWWSSIAAGVSSCSTDKQNAYVRKPVDFSQFVEAARTISHFWLRLNERVPARRRST
jgi:hypothetical protein